MVIGLFHHYSVGDNVKVLRALYLMKKIYGAKVVVFGNALLKMYLQGMDFVDSIEDIGSLESSHIPLINSYHLDYAILTNARTKFIKILNESNAKCVITRAKLPSLPLKKFKTLFTNLPPYRYMRGDDLMCEYVRLIDKKAYDVRIKSIESSDIDTHTMLQTSPSNKEYVNKLFATAIAGGGGGSLIATPTL